MSRAGYITIEPSVFVNPEGKEISYRRALITHEGREANDGEPITGIQMRDVTETSALPSKRSRGQSKSTASASRSNRRRVSRKTHRSPPIKRLLTPLSAHGVLTKPRR